MRSVSSISIWGLLAFCGSTALCPAQQNFVAVNGATEEGYVERFAPAPVRPANPPRVAAEESWWWIHTGVTMQLAGSFSDWATSWKQPEGNAWLTESGGRYEGRFYRSATIKRATFSSGLALASYVIAWKWPKTRKFLGTFNMTVGAGLASAAVSNVVRNPYYKP